MLIRTGPCRILVYGSEFLDAECPGEMRTHFLEAGGEGGTSLKLKWVAALELGSCFQHINMFLLVSLNHPVRELMSPIFR